MSMYVGDPIAALEIGSSWVRVLIGEPDEEGVLCILGLGEVQSSGVVKGELMNLEKPVACIREALRLAEDHAQVDIASVGLTFTGGHVRTLTNRGQVPIADPELGVTEQEAEAARNNARAVSIPTTREIIQSVPQHYYIDDGNPCLDPKGMPGSRLSAEMFILHGVRTTIQQHIRAAKDADLEVSSLAFSGLCAGLRVLSSDEKERGAIVIDLGGGTTDYVVYAEKAIAHAGCIAVGGRHMNNDISRGLGLTLSEAEKIKLVHGCAQVDFSKRTNVISIEDAVKGTRKQRLLVDLHTIMHARLDETFTIIKKELDTKRLSAKIGAGVFLVGGGANIPEIQTLASRVFNAPCEVAAPLGFTGIKDMAERPELATVAGMLYFTHRRLAQTAKKKISIFDLFGRTKGN